MFVIYPYPRALQVQPGIPNFSAPPPDTIVLPDGTGIMLYCFYRMSLIYKFEHHILHLVSALELIKNEYVRIYVRSHEAVRVF